MCDKVQYETYKNAIGAINKISKREKQGFRSYKCNECGKFHITSIKKKKLLKWVKEKVVVPNLTNKLLEVERTIKQFQNKPLPQKSILDNGNKLSTYKIKNTIKQNN